MGGSALAVTISAAVAGFFGLAFAVLGAVLALKERARRRRGEQAAGRVIDNVHGPGSTLEGRSLDSMPRDPVLKVGPVVITPNPRWKGHPVVEFTTVTGQVVRFRSSYGSHPPTHRVGDGVTVAYDPTEPSRAEIVGEGAFLQLAVMVLGLVFVAVGAALWFFAR